MSTRMAATDAQLFWLSAAVPNDQFLLYAFDGAPDVDEALAQVRRNAGRCDDLQLRVVDDDRWRYPRWRDCEVSAEQFVVHPVAEWPDCLNSIAALEQHAQLDATRMTWRFHVFPPNVVVIQVSHALADGTRSSALAATLLGRTAALPRPAPPTPGPLAVRAVAAARAHRQLMRDTEAGLLAAPNPPRPVLSVNGPRSGGSALHVIVVDRDRLRRPTVTVGSLVAVSEALGGYLADRGEDVARLGAEVPMATGEPQSRNNFRNVNLGLYPELEPPLRAARIAEELDGQRRRAQHPAERVFADAFAATPAALLRWGVSRFDPTARSGAVAGHTVVSSVYRGPADLTFGGAPVLFTAGFPALSPMMGLTHGVHGIGEAVAVSVHADPAVVDVGDYVDRLARALG